MAFIFYGSVDATIGIDELMIRCPVCEAHNFADVMVVSKYFHIYFIPVFPYAKEANVICQKCGLKRFGISLDKKLISDFDEVEKRFKHPWFAYAFMIFVSLLILGAIFI